MTSAEFPSPIGNLGPVADILFATTFAAGPNRELLRSYSSLVRDQILTNFSFLGAMIDGTERLHRGDDGGGYLMGVCSEFDGTFPYGPPDPGGFGAPLPFPVPSDIEVCIGVLLNVITGPQNPLTQQASYEVDQTQNLKIVSISPMTVCAGKQLTIHADASNPFDSPQPADLKVIFSRNVIESITTWSPLAVSVLVPQTAVSGLVFFGKAASSANADPGIAQSFLEQVAEACPLLGAGRAHGSVGLFAVQEGLQLLSPVYEFPDGRGYMNIVHDVSIESLVALDAAGQSVAGRTVEACTPITIKWKVKSDDTTPASVTLLSQGAVIASALPHAGTYVIQPLSSATITLQAVNSCGAKAFQTVNFQVVHRLHLTPNPVSVLEGGVATLTVELSCQVAGNSAMAVTVKSANPARVTVPATVSVPPGAKTFTIPVHGVSPGLPMGPTTFVTVNTPTASRTVQVWVESRKGQWDIVGGAGAGFFGPTAVRMGMVPVHAALLGTGKVLFFGADPGGYDEINKGESRLWDPMSFGSLRSPTLLRNLFCGGQCLLPDGRLLVAAGQSSSQSVNGAFGSWFGFGKGADHDIHVFDPLTESWTRLGDMPGARWYPTCTMLPSGKVLIVSGYAAAAHFTINDTYEIFDPSTGTLSTPKTFLPGIDLYPFVQVLPGGSLFVHSKNLTRIFVANPASAPLGMSLSPAMFPAISMNFRTYKGQGACVMLPIMASNPSRVRLLVVGGGDETKNNVDPNTAATDTAEIFDAGPSMTGWRSTAPMSNRRFMSDAVLLPDATVLVVGGARQGQADDNSGPVMEAELFDPEAETWRRMAAMAVERLYHSVALLLPSGQVLTAGSTGATFPAGTTLLFGEERLEIFSPPYLFRGPRPEISYAPAFIGYAQQFDVGTPDGTRISAVAFVRLGSTTHTNNMDQRYLGLSIVSRTQSLLEVMSPTDGTTAPPGYYMLFLLDQLMVPSIAKILRVG